MGFERVDFVTEPGEFAVRGGIIDVFSFAYQHPYRIEFFDDTIERLSSFHVENQRSVAVHDNIEILPDTSNVEATDHRRTILEFFPSNSIFLFSNLDKITDRLKTFFNKAKKTYASEGVESQYTPEDLFVHPEEWIKDLERKYKQSRLGLSS